MGHTKSRHVLARLDWQESDKRNLHARQSAQSIPSRVRNVETVAETTHADEDEGVDGEQASNKGIATPGSHHVTVVESAESAPEHGTLLERLDPEVEGEDKQEDGNGLVIVAASHRARDVARRDTHEDGGKETSRRVGGQLIGQEIGGIGGKAREGRSEKNANVANIDGDGQGPERVVDGTTGDHQSRVKCSSRDTTQRVPSPVIKPVPEVVEAIRDEVFGGSEVEPRVDCGNVS